MQKVVTFSWCTYRNWSFEVLEGLVSDPRLKCASILTTPDCTYDFSIFEAKGIRIFRLPPKQSLGAESEFVQHIAEYKPDCLFFYGWSWIVPPSIHDKYLCVTLHPGKLPDDRGGSPLQNQIRNGETWSLANLIELGEKLDGGDIFASEKFSLTGDINDVWARMTATGVFVTKKFLEQIAGGSLTRKVQTELGKIYKRVLPSQAEIKLGEQPALLISNIIRAHNENDPNTYVKKAYLKHKGFELVLTKAQLTSPSCRVVALASVDDFYELSHLTNNEEACLLLRANDDKDVYVTQFRVHGQ
ncbi:MAG: formyltransferase family protein [Bdellovibrionota bacterium]